MGSEMVQAIVKAEGMPAKGGDGKLARKVAETMCDMGEVKKVTSATAAATKRTHVFLVAKDGLLAVRQDSQTFTRIEKIAFPPDLTPSPSLSLPPLTQQFLGCDLRAALCCMAGAEKK